MKSLEIISALPQWAKATPDAILGSPAFLMPCRLGDETVSLRPAEVLPEEAEMIALAVSFGDEPHELLLSRSQRFPDLVKLWDSRADVPDQILLALVERECGPVFQMLENAVRRQMRLTGIAAVSGAPKFFLELSDGSLVLALTRSEAVVSALGALRNLDFSHEAVRSQTLSSEIEYAAFAPNDADLASLAPGDAVLLPEVGSVAPRLVVDGRFVLSANGVAPFEADSLVHVRAAEGRGISLGEVFDAIDTPYALPNAEAGRQLRLVRDGRIVASGRLEQLADQPAFVVEST